MSRTIELTDETARLVDEQLQSGRAATPDAIVRAGIAAIDAAAEDAAKLEAVRAALIEGEESGEAPPGSFDRARARIRELAAARRTP